MRRRNRSLSVPHRLTAATLTALLLGTAVSNGQDDDSAPETIEQAPIPAGMPTSSPPPAGTPGAQDHPAMPSPDESDASPAAGGAREREAGVPPAGPPMSRGGASQIAGGPPAGAGAKGGGPPPPPSAGGAKSGGASRRITVAFTEAKIEQVLASISSNSGATVTALGKAAGTRVTLLAKDQSLESVLDGITRPKGWEWWVDKKDGTYYIADRQYYVETVLPSQMVQKTFVPNHIKASDLKKAIDPLLEGQGSATADERTNKLIVVALPQVIERIERLIRELDLQLVTRVFYLRHAAVEDVAQKIETYKSGPGTIETDDKTHQIIVTDLLSAIKKMELLIDILDVGPEIVIYDVNNIGIDGKDLDDLKAIIDSIRTKDLLFEVNNKQGVFILEDVPEVHERVEQILQGFDRPTKQVLVQGELLSTKFNRTFSIGLDNLVISEDLFSARRGSVPTAAGVPVAGNTTTASTGSGSSGSATTTSGDPGKNLGFKNVDDIFPILGATTKGIGGEWLTHEVYVAYSAAYNNENTNVLLQPRLLVKNQQESKIFVGSEVPYLTTYYNDNVSGSNGARSQTQNTVTAGLDFAITPSISNSYLVELDLSISNDSAKPVPVLSANEITTLIQRDRQNMETVLNIPSGQTRVIGGLLTNTRTESEGGIPFLVSLPLIGPLFGKVARDNERQNLMLFITPTIVEDSIPRETSKNGRRGRLVTEYEKVPGDFDLNQPVEEDSSTSGTTTKPAAAVLDDNPNAESAIRELVHDYSTEAPAGAGQREGSFDPSVLRPGKGVVIGSEGGKSTGGPRRTTTNTPPGQPVRNVSPSNPGGVRQGGSGYTPPRGGNNPYGGGRAPGQPGRETRY